jgi:acetylornithine/succinyldiaminopimelate/putrescine aminotransferase
LVEKTRRHLNAGKGDWLLDLEMDLVVGQREGCFVYDVDGSRFLDADCDGTTFNLGHRHPRLVAKFKESADLCDIGYQFLPSAARVELAQELVSSLPPGLSLVHFATSGSEAIEAAIRAARAATGRQKIVSIRGARHGLMGLAGHLAGEALLAPSAGATASSSLQVRWDDLGAIEMALRRKDVAAVLIEPAPAALGWPMPSSAYHSGVRERCSAAGTLLVVDEGQTGLGRTGKLWAIEHWNLLPDILVMAKGASGGLYPLAYCVMNSESAEWMTSHPLSMLSTFAGSELGCLIGCEVLRVTKEPNFLATVDRTAQHLSAGLRYLASRFPTQIVEVRQLGLAAALKFTDPHGGALMMSALFRHHVWAVAAPFDLSVIQIKPPLIIDRVKLELLLDAIHAAVLDCWGNSAVRA